MGLSVKRIPIDALDAANPFQSRFWAQIKKASGWMPRAFCLNDGSGDVTVLVLVKRFSRFFSLAYIPMGLKGVSDENTLVCFAEAVKHYLPSDCMLLRADLDWGCDTAFTRFRKCRFSVQPEATVRLDLTKALSFTKRAARNLRKEIGVIVVPWKGDEESFHAWYECYVRTALRDGFTARGESYIRSFFSIDDPSVQPHLYLAYMDGTVCGGIMTLRTRMEEVYLFGASERLEGGVSCGYSLQTKAVMEAKNAGVAVYDLFGVSRPDGSDRHLDSLSVFKTAFGGKIEERTPSIDYIYRPVTGRLFRIADSLRMGHSRKI